jgi:hypothetical protein
MIFRSASVLELLCLFLSLRHSKALEGFQGEFSIMKDVEDVVVYISSLHDDVHLLVYDSCTDNFRVLFCAADVLWDSGSQFPVHGDRAVECYRVSRPHTRITAARYPVGNVWLACKFCESFARRQAIQALEKEGA